MNGRELVDAVARISERYIQDNNSAVAVSELSAAMQRFTAAHPSLPALEDYVKSVKKVDGVYYPRLIVNDSFDDPFHLVLAIWQKSDSPIHDHDGNAGAVTLLVGTGIYDIRYEIGAAYDEAGRELTSTGLDTGSRAYLEASKQSQLIRNRTVFLTPRKVTPIHPDRTTQIHKVVLGHPPSGPNQIDVDEGIIPREIIGQPNPPTSQFNLEDLSDELTVSLHVYLQPLKKVNIYDPVDGQSRTFESREARYVTKSVTMNCDGTGMWRYMN